MSWTIYCHTHVDSGRKYVGLTKQTMERRWATHVAKAKSSKGGRWHFPNAIRKYGPEAFSHEILEVCDTLEKANTAEVKWIGRLKTRDPQFGFNLAEGGQHKPHSIRKNPWNNPEYRTKQAARSLDYLHNHVAYAKMKATVNTPEFKAKQSAISKEIHSRSEVKIKLSVAARGRAKSSETLAKMSAAMRGHATSPETRAKIGAKSAGRKHSPESRAKMREVFGALPAAECTRQRLRKFILQDDGKIVKRCAVHGMVTDIYVKTRKGEPQVRCAICEKSKARARSR